MPERSSARGVEAAGAREDDGINVSIARSRSDAGPRDAHAAGVLAHVGAELERREAEAFRLAALFLADIAGRFEPWNALFTLWAAERNLSPELCSLVRVAVLRTRCFGAVERFTERQAAESRRRG